MASSVEGPRERARTSYNAGAFEQSREAALAGLAEDPDDVELLILAGSAGLEADAADAVTHLRRATVLAPENAAAWRHLGEALATEGDTAGADAAFRRVVELDPSDELALTHLGHTSVAAGRKDEGVGYLARAADMARSSSSTAAISLVEMYRSFGQYEQALEQARRIADAAPDDVLSLLDVAELSLQVGRLDDAAAAFELLRDIDDVPGHEAYPLHGLIQVEVRRGQWARAQELAAQASAIDPRGLSTDLGAFLREQIDDSGAESAPTALDVDSALASSLAVYRRMAEETGHTGYGGPVV